MIEFIEESHTYLVEGVITPSISQILKATKFKDKYKGIPEGVLKAKARFGTEVHKALENGSTEGLDIQQLSCYNEYLRLKKKHNIQELEREQIVHRKRLFAGTYDLEANIDGCHSLADYKTTAALDTEYISYQLSFYEWARGISFEKLYAIWLPKGELGKVVEVRRIPREELEAILDEYYESISEQDI